MNGFVFVIVKIYYGELLKLKDKIMKKFTILCKYIHIYIHWGIFLKRGLLQFQILKCKCSMLCTLKFERVLHFPLKWIYKMFGGIFEAQTGLLLLEYLQQDTIKSRNLILFCLQTWLCFWFYIRLNELLMHQHLKLCYCGNHSSFMKIKYLQVLLLKLFGEVNGRKVEPLHVTWAVWSTSLGGAVVCLSCGLPLPYQAQHVTDGQKGKRKIKNKFL